MHSQPTVRRHKNGHTHHTHTTNAAESPPPSSCRDTQKKASDFRHTRHPDSKASSSCLLPCSHSQQLTEKHDCIVFLRSPSVVRPTFFPALTKASLPEASVYAHAWPAKLRPSGWLYRRRLSSQQRRYKADNNPSRGVNTSVRYARVPAETVIERQDGSDDSHAQSNRSHAQSSPIVKSKTSMSAGGARIKPELPWSLWRLPPIARKEHGGGKISEDRFQEIIHTGGLQSRDGGGLETTEQGTAGLLLVRPGRLER